MWPQALHEAGFPTPTPIDCNRSPVAAAPLLFRTMSESAMSVMRRVRRPTEWATALLNAVVITLMNLVQAFIFAELVCRGTELDPCLVAPLQLFGMIVSQAVFLVRSRIARFAIASADTSNA